MTGLQSVGFENLSSPIAALQPAFQEALTVKLSCSGHPNFSYALSSLRFRVGSGLSYPAKGDLGVGLIRDGVPLGV